MMMRHSTDPGERDARDVHAIRAVATRSDLPASSLGPGFCGNDAAWDEDMPDFGHEIELREVHALRATSLGYVLIRDEAPSLWSSEIHQAALAHRAAFLGTLVAAVLQAIRRAVRRARARYRQRRQARTIHDAFHELDDRALHDLGFDRSEIASIAEEATGAAERTRTRVLLNAHTLPRL
jgi:uncharacterized protein YjiS (DUF1127 family)